MLENYGVDTEGPEEEAPPSAPAGMSEDAFKTLVGNEIRDALGYIDSEIAPSRQLNYEYYLGDMRDVPAIEGRSTVVMRVIADYVGFMLPSLLRTMISGRKVIEYPAKGIQDEAAAKAATDYVNDIVLRVDNKIEAEAYGWGFDGLVNKVGVLKVWWEEQKEFEDFNFPPMDDLQFTQTVISAEQQGLEIAAHDQDPVTGLHQLVLRRVTDKSRVKFEVLPPEEFVISRDARSLESARLKSHRTYKYVGELIEEGYDADQVMRLPSYNASESNAEAEARQPGQTGFAGNTNLGDPMLRKVAVHAGTILCDKDGTGLREWYFVAGGWANSIEILAVKPFEDECYFCDFCPIPLPHLFFGRCPADDLIEIQRIQTVLARQTMDNIYLTNAPQQEVLVGNIIGQRLEYVQNKSPGGIIPVTALGSVNNITVPFVASQSLELMQYWDAQAESRTGAGRNTLGLDPEVLQGQSATAARLQDNSSKLKLETIARIWATGGMRKLGRAILRILKRRQNFARMVKLNGQETQVNPAAWAELQDWDVTVNTGLGTGDRSKDVQALGLIIQKMEAVMEKFGPTNPVVTPPMLADAYGDLVEALGISNGDKYFKPLPADFQPPPPPPPQEPPQVQVAKIKALSDQTKADKDNATKQQKAQSDNLLDYILGMREQDMELILEAWKANNKGADIDTNIAKVPGQRTH